MPKLMLPFWRKKKLNFAKFMDLLPTSPKIQLPPLSEKILDPTIPELIYYFWRWSLFTLYSEYW